MVQSQINKIAINVRKNLRAIDDLTRLKLCIMVKEKPYHVKELIKRLKIEATLLSHHLAILRDAGFIKSTREGKQVIYTRTKETPLVLKDQIVF